MVIPRFREDYENKSIKELIKEQQEIMKLIAAIENNHILKEDNSDKMISPSPITVWRYASQDLIMITELIDEKTRYKEKIDINSK